MTANRKNTPYTIPSAWRGDKLIKVTQKFDRVFHQAIRERAAQETSRYKNKHSTAVVLMNLALRDRELRQRYSELKQQEKKQREEEHHYITQEFETTDPT